MRMRQQGFRDGGVRVFAYYGRPFLYLHSFAIVNRSARLAHDNTFLSYHRNAIIATVAGCALIQYRKGEGRPPLAGTGLLIMGGLYIYVGSGLYIWQTWKLRHALRLGFPQMFWSVFNAMWPLAIWSVSLACLLDETPGWLIECLRRSEFALPATLRTSLFLDPPAIYPVCRLLHAVLRHEERRLQTVAKHAEEAELGSYRERPVDGDGGRGLSRSGRRLSLSGGWGVMQVGQPLSDADVATIIAKRLERLKVTATHLPPYLPWSRLIPPLATRRGIPTPPSFGGSTSPVLIRTLPW